MLNKDYEKLNYYNVSSIECIDIITELNLNFSEGNAFKYLYRSNNVRPKGDILHDLNKSIYYLNKMYENMRKTIKYKDPEYFMEKLDPSMFSENVFEAMRLTLYSACQTDLTIKQLQIEEAKDLIENEIELYL